MSGPTDTSGNDGSRRHTRRSLLRAGGCSLALLAGCGSVDERVTTEPPGSPALSPTGAWPQYRFDAGNTAYDPSTAGITDLDGRWVLDAGTAPAVRDGRMVNLFSHDLEITRATIRDPATATVERAVDLVGYGVTDAVGLGPDVAYVTAFVKPFGVGLDGTVRWEGPELDGMSAPPTVAGGDAFYVGTGFVSRGNPPAAARIGPDGTVTWSRKFDSEPARAVAPAVDGDRVVVPFEEELVCLSATDGTRCWRTAAAGRPGTVALRDDLLVVHGSEGLVALDVADGSVVWRREGGDPARGLVLTEDRVVAGGPEGVRTRSLADGAKGWHREVSGRPMAGTGRTLYLTEGRRGRDVVARSLADGTEHWRFRTPDVQVRDVILAGVEGIASAGQALYVRSAYGLHGIAGAA